MIGSVLPWNPEIRIDMGDRATIRSCDAVPEHTPKQSERARVGERT